ncbi:helix-turn-helix transcriptional regulator [Candidatus Latescibacterota bacterium]
MKKNKFIKIPELAKYLGLSRTTIYNRVKKGDIPAEKVGRTYSITDKTINEILGKELTAKEKKMIEAAVERTVREYGEVLIMLGNE